jgi:capsule polysaccharide export protein KpsE/RkpR
MILSLIIAVFMLGSSSFKERKSAKHELINSEYTFLEIKEVYEHKDIQSDPEIRLTLKEILKLKYYKEYVSLHTSSWGRIDYTTLEKAFNSEMKYKIGE